MLGSASLRSIVLQTGGVDLVTLIAVVVTIALVLSMVFLVVVAIGPHLSTSWAERFGGSAGSDPDPDVEESADANGSS